MPDGQAGAARVAAIVKGVTGVMTGVALARVQRSVGMKAKTEALGAAAKDLGGDRAMSNFRGGKRRLGAGYDAIPNGVAINLRPAGLWKLADAGRKRSGRINPKRGHHAVLTPRGYRHHSNYKKSRGLKTISHATADVDKVAGRETDRAIQRELARVVR